MSPRVGPWEINDYFRGAICRLFFPSLLHFPPMGRPNGHVSLEIFPPTTDWSCAVMGILKRPRDCTGWLELLLWWTSRVSRCGQKTAVAARRRWLVTAKAAKAGRLSFEAGATTGRPLFPAASLLDLQVLKVKKRGAALARGADCTWLRERYPAKDTQQSHQWVRQSLSSCRRVRGREGRRGENLVTPCISAHVIAATILPNRDRRRECLGACVGSSSPAQLCTALAAISARSRCSSARRAVDA